MLNFKSQLVNLVGPFGGYKLCRSLSSAVPRILMYHRFSETTQPGFVSRENFDRQVEYLRDKFNLITMDELVRSYHQQRAFAENSVVITVDDGYSDFYEIAFPILKKYDVPATFFVTTQFVDGAFWLWPDVIKLILEYSVEIDLDKVAGGLKFSKKPLSAGDRQILWNMLITYLLSITEDEKNRWIRAFADIQAVHVPARPTQEYRAVNWDQVIEMDTANIEIGVHTQSHPSLGMLEEYQLSTEIQGAVDIIENQINHRPVSFCFPNGQPADYTEVVKQHVKEAGCQSAVTAFYDQHICDDLFELRRFCVSNNWQYFLRAVNGVDALAAKWFKTDNIMKVSM